MRLKTLAFSRKSLAAIAGAGCASSAASAGLLLPAVWDGSCSNEFWHSTCGPLNGTTNWNDDNIPTLGTQVSIPMGAPAVTIVTTAAASSLDCQSGLTIQGGALEMAGSSTIHNLTMNSISAFGLQIDAGEVLLETACNWMLGRMSGAGAVKNRGMMTGVPEVQGTVTFYNQSTASLKSMTIGSTAAVVNGTASSMTFGATMPALSGLISGTGLFTNLGTLITHHQPGTHFDINCQFLQHAGGSLLVTGATNGGGTRFENDATFDGGTVTVNDDSHLRFRNDGGGAEYLFNGLPAITGNGNMYLEMPFSTPWKVESDLVVELYGTSGFVLNGGDVTLSAALRNRAKALWNGALLKQAACGLCAPEFRNEGDLRINSSGVILDTWLNNQAGATATQEFGGISFRANGLISNYGFYEHQRGNMTRALPGATTGTFVNNAGATYYRPASNTGDVTISTGFVIQSGSLAQFDSARTDFAGNPANGEGLLLQGGDVSVFSPGIVRVYTGRVQNNNQEVYGDGEFRIGGSGGNTDFLITGDVERTFIADLGPLPPDGGDSIEAATSGLYLDVGAHIGGPGYLDNKKIMYLNGGTIGVGGTGRILNEGDAYMENSTGINGVNARLENEDYVEQAATLTMNDGTVENRYDWFVVAPVTLQSFGAGVFRNLGLGRFVADPGSGQTVNVSAKFDNTADVLALSGTLNFTGNVLQLSGGVLNGGIWAVGPGATLDLPGTLTSIGPNAFVVHHSTATFNDLKSLTTNNGHLEVDNFNFNSSWTNNGTAEFGGTAPVDIQGGNGNLNNGNSGQSVLAYADNNIVPSFTEGGGRGVMPFALRCANFNNYATVRPGGPNQPGPFKMDGNFNQFANGTVQIELEGATPVSGHDQLIIDGNVALAGTLNVRVLPGFTPSIGQQFTIIAASNGTISGTFSQITGYGQYSAAYSPSAVTLTVLTPPKAGDTNGDGVVNVSDLINVITSWGMCPIPPTFCAGDLNGDGMVNVSDLLIVITNWG